MHRITAEIINVTHKALTIGEQVHITETFLTEIAKSISVFCHI